MRGVAATTSPTHLDATEGNVGETGRTFTLHGMAPGEGFAEATVWVDGAGRIVDVANWVERAIDRLDAKPKGHVSLSVTVWDGEDGR